MIYIYIIVILIVVLFLFIQPLIVLFTAWWNTNFSEKYLRQSLPYSSDISGFDGLPNIAQGDQLLGQATTEQSCENGYYVGFMEMNNVDCTQICNATSDKLFMYKYISENNVIINNQYLRKGGWCLPTSLARCNLNISIAIKSVGRYECISKHPSLLGGQYGNDIIGCAPMYEFNDNLKKLTYTNNVPSTLVIDDLDAKLPDSDEYRYTCNTNNGQFSTLAQRPDLGDRFQLFYDSCSFFDAGGRMVDNKCQCSSTTVAGERAIVKPLQDGQSETMVPLCSTCTSGYEIVDEKYPQTGSKYGVSIGVNCVDPERIEYYKSQYIEMNGVIPCGVNTLLGLRESSSKPTYGCHRALVNVTNSYTPEMLQLING